MPGSENRRYLNRHSQNAFCRKCDFDACGLCFARMRHDTNSGIYTGKSLNGALIEP